MRWCYNVSSVQRPTGFKVPIKSNLINTLMEDKLAPRNLLAFLV